MIRKSEQLSLVEVKELLKKLPDSEKVKEVSAYLKRFIKIEPAQAKKLKKELQEELPNLSSANIAKIMDILPHDSGDVRKIFVDTSLDENEIAKILEIVKKYL